jgi:hypothetical protein
MHQASRKRWAEAVASGSVKCARCKQLIHPLEPWDLDHRDDRRGYLGPSHRACNRAVAGGRVRKEPIPPDNPERNEFYGPNGEKWSRVWHEWR